MFGEVESIEQAIEYARKLQSSRCGYGTTEGDGKSCDCKFLPTSVKGWFRGGEQTGCCEGRALLRYLLTLQEVSLAIKADLT